MSDSEEYDEMYQAKSGSTAGLDDTRTPSPAISTGDNPSKKVRKNHNEFERKRRDLQRQRLDELRAAVPGLDPKASMVAVLTASKLYIDQLRGRNAVLEGGHAVSEFHSSLANIKVNGSGNMMGKRAATPPSGVPRIVIEGQTIGQTIGQTMAMGGPSMAMGGPSPLLQSLPYALPPILAPKPSLSSAMMINHLLDHSHPHPYTQQEVSRKVSSESEEGDAFFRKGRAQLVDQLPPVSAFVPPESTVFAPHTQHTHTQHAHMANTHTMHTMRRNSPSPTPGPSYPNMARPSLLTTAIQDSFSFPARPRADSGLLLPTEDPSTFYFGHRDAMQSLTAVPLPMIMDEQSAAYVRCDKCTRGVGGLVMIDCDRCRKWVHIRCVGIDATSIPVKWTCSECPNS